MTADTRAADEEAIRAADAAWSKAAGDKDAAKMASFYAENAVVMAPGMAAVKGRDAIQQAMTGMMQDPNFALSFAPTKIVVAKARRHGVRAGRFFDDDERQEKEAEHAEGDVCRRLGQADGWELEGAGGRADDDGD